MATGSPSISETNSYAEGHTWGTWTVNDSENHSATCTVCGESETTVHIFVEYIPNNDATKDADGYELYTCANGCGNTNKVTLTPGPFATSKGFIVA